MARSAAGWLIGVAGCALALELLFRLLPVASSTETGYYNDPLILSYPPHHRWTAATGWDLRNAQRLQANNAGFVADRDFVHDPTAVALIGDSFIEASMLAAPDRPGAQLERALGARPVYALGAPGTALLDFAERIRYAHVQYGIRDFVVLMGRSDVLESLCGSGNVNGPCLDPQTLAPRNEPLPTPGRLKRLLRHSALAQYLVSQLKFSPQRLFAATATPAPHPAKPSAPTAVAAAPAAPLARPDVDTVSHTFFARIRPHVGGRLLIVLDADRSALYAGQPAQDPIRERFIALAAAEGFPVLDMQPIYQAQLARSPLRLDVGPYDKHLNALGVRLVAEAAARALQVPPSPP